MSDARAPLRWLSLVRWENTQTCCARAPCRADCDRPTHYGKTLHRREASLLPCKTVVRRASCDLQRTAGFRVADARAPLRWLCLGRWQNTRACRARAPCRAALAAVDPCTTEGHCTGGRPLSFGASPRCDVRAVTSNAQPAFAWHERKPHCAGCLSGCGETRELAVRAHRAALVVIVYARHNGSASAEGLSLSVQGRGATCELWPPTRSRYPCGTRASATAVAVSREVAKHASLPRARAVSHWLWLAYAL